MSLTTEDREELRKYVECVFQKWWGLQVAIQDCMGSDPTSTKKKVEQMIEMIVRLCSAPQTEVETLWNTLEDLSWEYFKLEFEDDSPEEVAEILFTNSRDFLAGNSDKIRSFINTVQKLPMPKVESCDTDEEDIEEMETDEVETKKSGPDEDGWEVPKNTFKPRSCRS